MSWQVIEGDCREQLARLEPQSVQTCVTSPPYWGLRDYGTDGQLGLEPTPEEYVANLVEVFREVRRVLRDDGTVWLNLGDSYAAARSGFSHTPHTGTVPDTARGEDAYGSFHKNAGSRDAKRIGLKHKDLVGIPWRVAFALQADGWWLRSDIIWAKPNPMPESVTDRPTRAHEYVFLLSKSARYFYDADAIRENFVDARMGNPGQSKPGDNPDRADGGIANNGNGWDRGAELGGRNRRSVWEIATQPYPDAHFATFPPKLVEPCILAGSPPKCCGECGAPWERVVEEREIVATKDATGPATEEYGEAITAGTQAQRRSHGASLAREAPRTLAWTPGCSHGYENLTDVSDGGTGQSTVLDPFAGAGTTGLVALRHNRSFIGIELNPTYAEMARNRIRDDAPLLNVGAEAA